MSLEARRRNANRRNDAWLRVKNVLIDLDDAHAQAQAEAEHCPFCEALVHPDNWKAHMEAKHEEEWDGTMPGRKRSSKDTLPVTLIRADGGTQPRALIDEEVVRDYAQAMTDGAEFPALVVFYDGAAYWLADGFHRLNAARTAGRRDVRVEIHQGTQRDAILWSVGANATHGLRRTNADKRRAVERLLRDEEWSKWSDNKIAQQCAVDHKTVSRVRADLGNSQVTRTYVTKHGTPATMNTAAIGKPTVKPALPTSAPAYLQEAVDLGALGAQQAVSVAKTLEDAAPEVAEAAVAHNVTDPQLVQLLDAKKDTNTVQDALASGYLQDGDTAKPLSEATAWDLQGLLRKGEQEHREAARDARIAGKMAQIQSAPDGVFSVIYADPPWQYDNSGLHGAAERHYPTMPTADIGGLVKKIGLQSTEDAVLFLWATNPLLIDALEVIAAWGFQYKTNLVWVKDRSCYGRLGFYTQGQHELLLIATRGSFLPQFKPSSVMDLAKGAHSEKPTAVYALIETMYPVQRYVELFARDNQERPGWSFWGAEANAST